MASPKIKKHTLYASLAAVIIIVVALLYAIPHFHPKPLLPVHASTASPRKSIPPVSIPPPVNRGLPTRLTIARTKTDAKILYEGVTNTGAMDTPTNVTDVGWYKYGPLPGNMGSAVIAGHIDGLRGEPGVFSKLTTLQPGDRLSVTDSTGRVTDFVVRELRTYDQNEQPAEVFSSAGGAHLNLITCTGTWDAAQHHFLKRLVVFTDKAV